MFAANWKMNGEKESLAKWLGEFSPPLGCKTALLPPTPYLHAAQQLLENSPLDHSNTIGDAAGGITVSASESPGNTSRRWSTFFPTPTWPRWLTGGDSSGGEISPGSELPGTSSWKSSFFSSTPTWPRWLTGADSSGGEISPGSELPGTSSWKSPFSPSMPTLLGRLALGAQNISAHEYDGAHTGEVSARMAADVGCKYTLVGHSERRAAGETDDDCAKKIAAALHAGLSPIVCIGETAAEDAAGRAQDAIEKQLRKMLSKQLGSIANIAIAYEPVWAIGSGKTPSAERLQKTREDIRRHLLALSAADGGDIPILYGGSIAPDNAALLAEAGMDGGLVGGASLSAAAFMKVCEAGGGGAAVVK